MMMILIQAMHGDRRSRPRSLPNIALNNALALMTRENNLISVERVTSIKPYQLMRYACDTLGHYASVIDCLVKRRC